jgi:hypothetical protein
VEAESDSDLDSTPDKERSTDTEFDDEDDAQPYVLWHPQQFTREPIGTLPNPELPDSDSDEETVLVEQRTAPTEIVNQASQMQVDTPTVVEQSNPE